jgi:hypothetical protein
VYVGGDGSGVLKACGGVGNMAVVVLIALKKKIRTMQMKIKRRRQWRPQSVRRRWKYVCGGVILHEQKIKTMQIKMKRRKQ